MGFVGSDAVGARRVADGACMIGEAWLRDSGVGCWEGGTGKSGGA